MNNKELIWLWLEDEPNTTRDIEVLLTTKKIRFEKFKSQNELFKRLIELKKTGELQNHGLLLDILLKGTPFIMIPTEWSGQKDIVYVHTSRGYNAGLILCKEAILKTANDFWKPLPPVIFLTITFEDADTRDLIDEMKNIWSGHNNEQSGPAKIALYRKWDITSKGSEFINNLKDW